MVIAVNDEKRAVQDTEERLDQIHIAVRKLLRNWQETLLHKRQFSKKYRRCCPTLYRGRTGGTG